MQVLQRAYDFGPMLPPGITVPAAVKHLLSAAFGLPSGAFEEQYEKWHANTISEAFIDALEHLSVYPSYEAAIVSALNGTYLEGPRNVAALYTDAVRTVATKIMASKPKTYSTEAVYNAYLAVNILTNLLRSGKSDCREYIDLLPFEVVDVYGSGKARSEFPDVEVVYGIYKRGALDTLTLQVLEFPRRVASLVRKRYFRAYASALETIKRQSIFTAFFEKVVADMALSFDEGLSQLAALPDEEQLELVERVYDLYRLGLVDTAATVAIPSEKEIDAVEDYVLPSSEESVVFSDDGVRIDKTVLNYHGKTAVLHVDDIKFPTIAHYVYYCLSSKRYSKIVSDGQFIVPELSDPYHFLPPLDEYYYRVAHMNELEGVGRKYTDDLLESIASDTRSSARVSGGSFVDSRLGDLAESSRRVLQQTSGWTKTSPLLLGAVEWAYGKRRYVSDELSRIVGIRSPPTRQEKMVLAALSLGPCIPAAVDFGESIDKILFETCCALMGSVLALSARITPEKVIDYARRNAQTPRLNTKLPRAIAHPAVALGYIMRVLEPMFSGEPDSARLAKTSMQVLVGRAGAELPGAVYNDYTDILSLELGIDRSSAALVNGFIEQIPSMDNSDDIYRRIVFYARQ